MLQHYSWKFQWEILIHLCRFQSNRSIWTLFLQVQQNTFRYGCLHVTICVIVVYIIFSHFGKCSLYHSLSWSVCKFLPPFFLRFRFYWSLPNVFDKKINECQDIWSFELFMIFLRLLKFFLVGLCSSLMSLTFSLECFMVMCDLLKILMFI